MNPRGLGTLIAGLALMLVGAGLFPFTFIGLLGWLFMFAGLVLLIVGCGMARAPEANSGSTICGLALGIVGAIAFTYCCGLAATVGIRWGLPTRFKSPSPGLTTFDEATEHVMWLCYGVVPAIALVLCFRLRGRWPSSMAMLFGLLFAFGGLVVAILVKLLCPYLPFGS